MVQQALSAILAFLQSMLVIILTKLGLIDLQGQQIIGDLDLLKSQAQLTQTGLFTVEQMLGQLQTSVNAIRTGGTVDLTPVLAAINTRASASVAPSWWVSPPTPPTPPSSGDNASAVWSFRTGFPSGNALGALSEIRYGVVQRDVASGGYPLGNWPGWWIEGPFWNSVHVPNPGRNVIALDFSTILPTDATPDAWVEREYPDSNWFTPFNGYPILLGDDSFRYFLPWLTQPEFDRIKAAMLPSSVRVPPIWPGLAGVTLGTPVALDVGLTVTTPMQGCLVSLTSVPVKQGYFTFDDVKSYRNVGAVAFVSDDGQEEYPQTLGFESAVYCPKTMTTATAVKVRTAAGIVGTITPFTIP